MAFIKALSIALLLHSLMPCVLSARKGRRSDGRSCLSHLDKLIRTGQGRSVKDLMGACYTKYSEVACDTAFRAGGAVSLTTPLLALSPSDLQLYAVCASLVQSKSTRVDATVKAALRTRQHATRHVSLEAGAVQLESSFWEKVSPFPWESGVNDNQTAIDETVKNMSKASARSVDPNSPAVKARAASFAKATSSTTLAPAAAAAASSNDSSTASVAAAGSTASPTAAAPTVAAASTSAGTAESAAAAAAALIEEINRAGTERGEDRLRADRLAMREAKWKQLEDASALLEEVKPVLGFQMLFR